MIILNDDNDVITWKWTTDRKYIVASAYDCQFLRSMTFIPAQAVGKARTEPKCKFLAWLIIHDKTLMTDNMLKHNWPCNFSCPLCYCLPESNTYLFMQCNFTKVLWNKAVENYQLPGYQCLVAEDGPIRWVDRFRKFDPSMIRHTNLGILFTTWWQLWKERNCRIFKQKETPVNGVFQLLKEQINLLAFALNVEAGSE